MTLAQRRTFVPMPAVLALLGLILLLAIMASLSLVPFLAGALGPTGAVSHGLIAFERDGDIYVADPEPGSEPRAIVSGPTQDVGPLWSPDGRHLLFFRITPEGETPMLTDADGSEPVALVDAPLVGGNWVDWTSDSSALVLSLDPSPVPASQPSGLVLLPVDGSGELRSMSENVAQAPVSYARARPGTGASLDVLYRLAADPAELRWLGPNGGGQVLRTSDMAGVRTPSYKGENDFWYPAWSPQGDRFAYHTLNDVTAAPDGNGFRVHVARFEPDHPTGPAGQGDTLVEFDPMADDEGWPVWSPDGSRIAFQTYDDGNARLVIVPVTDDGLPDVSAAVATESFPTFNPGGLYYDWAADGSRLVVVNSQARDDPTYLVDATTGMTSPRPFGWGTPDWPSWQPSAG